MKERLARYLTALLIGLAAGFVLGVQAGRSLSSLPAGSVITIPK